MRYQWKRLLVLAFALVLAVTAGAAAAANVGVIFATGGLGDRSFNDSGYAGVEMAENELGITFDYVEPTEIAEYESQQRAFAGSGQYDLIVMLGFDQADALATVAADFPEQKFVLIDAVVDLPNVASITFKDNEKTFLVGAMAGLMNQESSLPKINVRRNIIGVVGGMDIPLIRAFVAGYTAGARFVNSDVTVLTNYVGAWNDPATAKEMAIAMYDRGANIVYQAAGGSGLGVFQAARDVDRYAIGTDAPQAYLAPDHILVSAVRRLDNVVFQQIADMVDGDWEGGIYDLGLADEAVSYSFEGSNITVPEYIVEQVEELRERVVSGELAIPRELEAVDAFLAAHSE